MQKDEQLIPLFDEQGNIIDKKFRSQVDKNNSIIKCVNILVLNKENKIFITEPKDLAFNKKYASSACGLVRDNETLEEAAKRTTKRELNLDSDLIFIKEQFYNFNGAKKFMATFYIKTEKQPIPNEEDIKSSLWMSFQEIEKNLNEFMPTFLESFKIVKEKLIEKKTFVAMKAVILNENNEMLLIREGTKDPTRSNVGMWDGPGGRLEFGEDPIEGLKREIKEEIGLEIEVEKPLDISYWMPKKQNEQWYIVALFMLCKAKYKEIKLDNFENDSYKWVNIKDLANANIIPTTLKALKSLIKIDISKEKLNLKQRTINIDLKDLFPNLDINKLNLNINKEEKNEHKKVLEIARELANNNQGYISTLKNHGFYSEDKEYQNHCQQSTCALALNLKLLGDLDKIAYLECYRIKEHFPETGIIEQVDAKEEPDPNMRNEFIEIGRIPYCCLEITINNKKYYISGKHLKVINNEVVSALSPQCYEDFKEGFQHQQDKNKSGIYLKIIKPKNNPQNIDFNTYPVWTKQVPGKDLNPEYFSTYLRMELK